MNVLTFIGFHFHTFLQQSRSFGNNGIAYAKTLFYDLLLPIVLREERDSRGFRLPTNDTIYKRAVLKLIGCFLRDDDAVLAMQRHNDGRAASIMQEVLGIGERGTKGDCSC